MKNKFFFLFSILLTACIAMGQHIRVDDLTTRDDLFVLDDATISGQTTAAAVSATSLTVSGTTSMAGDVSLTGAADLTLSTGDIVLGGGDINASTANITTTGDLTSGQFQMGSALTTGDWDEPHLEFGSYHVWNSSGTLRIKNGAPSSSGDGSAVGGATGGDMLQATYDAAAVSEQLLGLTASQSPTNKTFNSSNTWTQGLVTLNQGPSAAPTAEGNIQWDTDDDRLKIGDGGGTVSFTPDTVAATLQNKTLDGTNSLNNAVIELDQVVSASVTPKGLFEYETTRDKPTYATGTNAYALASLTRSETFQNKTIDNTNVIDSADITLDDKGSTTTTTKGYLYWFNFGGLSEPVIGDGTQISPLLTRDNDLNGTTVKNKSFDSSNSWAQGNLTLKNEAGATSVDSSGEIALDTTANRVKVFINGAQYTIPMTTTSDTLSNKTLDEPTLILLNEAGFASLNEEGEIVADTTADEIMTWIGGASRYVGTATTDFVEDDGKISLDASGYGSIAPTSGDDWNAGTILYDNTNHDNFWILDGVPGASGVKTWTADETTATLSNKTMASSSSWSQGTITLKQSASPTPTAEGDIQWDTDDDELKIGTGGGTITIGAGAGAGAFQADANSQITPTTSILLDQATGNEIALDLSGTVNKATSGNVTFVYADITDTASPNDLDFIDFLVGGVTQFSVSELGDVYTDGVMDAEGTISHTDASGNPLATLSTVQSVGAFSSRDSSGNTRFRAGMADASNSHVYVGDSAGTAQYEIHQTEGFIVGDAADADWDVINVDLASGDALIYWDDSEDRFDSNHGIAIGSVAGTDEALLTEGANGGTLQISNSSGTSRILAQVDGGGAGYFALNDGSGIEDFRISAAQGAEFAEEITQADNTGGGTVRWQVNDAGIEHRGTAVTVNLANAATTFAILGNFQEVNQISGSSTIATITGAPGPGCVVMFEFVDAGVTITDDNSHAADTVDLSASFTSADDTILTLVYDGTSWYEVSRSVN